MFDAAHDAGPIVMAVGGRNVVAVVCTHGHNDHVTVAPELGEALDAPVLLHPADDVLWRMTHPDKDFRAVSDGETLRVAGTELRALHTPGHSPGSVCWHAPELQRGVQRRHAVRGRAGRDGHGRTPTSRPSWSRSRAGSASCPATPSSTPATATPPPSATRSCTTTNGSPAATNLRSQAGVPPPRERPCLSGDTPQNYVQKRSLAAVTRSRGCGASRPRTPPRSARRNPAAPPGS